jgi:lactoylglutathione lyase
MRYLHTMIRVLDLHRTVTFFELLGLHEARRHENAQGRYTLVFMNTGTEGDTAEVELTYNWDQREAYGGGRNFGHLAFQVDDIYATCKRLRDGGVDILRPPRDGRMAFVRSPDQISIELLQKGAPKPSEEPWASLPNQGEW